MTKYLVILSLGVLFAAGCGSEEAPPAAATTPGATTPADPANKAEAAGGASAPSTAVAAPDWAKTGTPTGK